jgi:hypothetical protein
VGYTHALELRKWWHARKPVAFMKCAESGGEWSYDILEDDIPTLEAALALEAMHAARLMDAEPDHVRGGPWVKPTLPHGARSEVRAVASVRSLSRLHEIAEEMRGGLLWKHLKDLDFVTESEAPSGAVATRGRVVLRKRKGGRSGCPGSASRRSQLKRKVLTRGSEWYKRLKRGIDPKARRKVEEAKRERIRKPRLNQKSRHT